MIGHPNLKAWYRFQDDGADSSGNGFTGTLIASPTFGAAIQGKGIILNGSTQTVDCGLPLGAGSGGTKSVSMWINPVNTTAGYILANYDAGSQGFSILKVGTTNFVGIAWTGSASAVTTAVGLSTGVWTHLSAVFSAGATGGQIFINGVLSVSGNLGTEQTATNKIKLGSRWVSANSGYAVGLNGSLDEVQFYNFALSASDVKRVMQGKHPLARS